MKLTWSPIPPAQMLNEYIEAFGRELIGVSHCHRLDVHVAVAGRADHSEPAAVPGTRRRPSTRPHETPDEEAETRPTADHRVRRDSGADGRSCGNNCHRSSQPPHTRLAHRRMASVRPSVICPPPRQPRFSAWVRQAVHWKLPAQADETQTSHFFVIHLKSCCEHPESDAVKGLSTFALRCKTRGEVPIGFQATGAILRLIRCPRLHGHDAVPRRPGRSRCCGHRWRSPPGSRSSGWSACPSPRSQDCSPASSASPISTLSHSPSPGRRARKRRHRQRPRPATCRRSSSPPLPPGQPRRPPRTARRIHHRAGAHRGMHGPALRRASARTAPILRFKPAGVPEDDQPDRLPSRGSTWRGQGRVARRHGLAPPVPHHATGAWQPPATPRRPAASSNLPRVRRPWPRSATAASMVKQAPKECICRHALVGGPARSRADLRGLVIGSDGACVRAEPDFRRWRTQRRRCRALRRPARRLLTLGDPDGARSGGPWRA
jgi:hypothetical protein